MHLEAQRSLIVSVMKRIFMFVLALAVSVSSVLAQDVPAENSDNGKFPFAIKAYPFRGAYLDSGTHWDKFGGAYPAGVHLGFELPSQQQRPWQQYLNNATFGVGLSWLDLGHKMLGHSIAAYPYVLLNAIDADYLQMRVKVAGGLAYVTEHWYTQEDQNPDHYYEPTVNTVFGCYLNVYLNAGVQLNVPITKYLALGTEFGYFHMSNGRTSMPNIGANAIYGSVGVTATFNSEAKKKPVQFPDLPYGWALNITGAAGAQKPAIEDTHRYLISSLHIAPVYHVNNWYAVGLGLDVFFNDAVSKNTERNLYCHGDFNVGSLRGDFPELNIPGKDSDIIDCTTCGAEKAVDYGFAQKVRAGIALNNEFKFGAVTAIVDWGVYFYNPSRNIYYDYHYDNFGKVAPKRPLLYTTANGAGGEEASHYIRFGLKYRVWDNLYLHTSAKTHLHICEFIEFGLGYQIPFLKKENRSEGKSIIFHHRKNWWKE